MLRYFLFILLLAESLSTWACSGVQDEDDTLAGRHTSWMRCRADTGVSYELYLPSGYTPEKKWPVIIGFDSHGDGRLPVNLFREEAEKRGYILLGSNNSKNGVPFWTCVKFYNAMRKDVQLRFSVDTGRIYTLGFSGGARVAGGIGMLTKGIRGVISCGAGLPNLNKKPETGIFFIGVAGDADMNYVELKRLNQALDSYGIPNCLLVFQGIHAWPPAYLVPEIIDWLEMKAMKDKQLEVDRDFISRVTVRFERQAAQAAKEGKPLLQAYYLSLGARYADGFPEAAAFLKQLGELVATDEYRNAALAEDSLLKLENSLQRSYFDNMNSKNESWWKEEKLKIDRFIRDSADKSRQTMYARLNAFLSLSAYSNVLNALRSAKPEDAEKYNRIYAVVDPSNPEHAYQAAMIFMLKGMNKEALDALGRAVALGFTDADRFQNDIIFAPLRQEHLYRELIGKMK